MHRRVLQTHLPKRHDARSQQQRTGKHEKRFSSLLEGNYCHHRKRERWVPWYEATLSESARPDCRAENYRAVITYTRTLLLNWANFALPIPETFCRSSTERNGPLVLR